MTLALSATAVTARRKIARRLLPFLFLIYMTAFIDRVNVGFAGLDMTRELHFSNEVFGFGAGIFFVGLCLLEIPGAMIAHSHSARIWIASIMIVWGTLAALTGLIHTATQFNIIRFFLGAAEGGFFPAVMVYMTHWFRQGRSRQGRRTLHDGSPRFKCDRRSHRRSPALRPLAWILRMAMAAHP